MTMVIVILFLYCIMFSYWFSTHKCCMMQVKNKECLAGPWVESFDDEVYISSWLVSMTKESSEELRVYFYFVARSTDYTFIHVKSFYKQCEVSQIFFNEKFILPLYWFISNQIYSENKFLNQRTQVLGQFLVYRSP